MSTTSPDVAPALRLNVPAAAAGWVDVRAGVGSMLPLVVAYAPFALVIGAAVAGHGLPAGIVGTVAIFGGSAQLATIRSLEASGVAAALLAGLVVNARLVVYSAGLARRWRGQPRWFRLVAAAFVIDPTWAMAERLAEECPDPGRQRRRFLAAGATLGAGFTAMVAIGIVAGTRVGAPDLEVAVPLCLLALVGPSLHRASDRRVVAASVAVALLTVGWPSGTGLLAATFCGCLAGASRREGLVVSVWLAVLGVGLGSYAFRVVPLLVLDRAPLSPRVEALISRAGLAAITALIALSTHSVSAGGAAPEALAGVGVGAVAASRRAPMLLVVAAGGAMYAAVRLGRTAFG